MVEVDEMYVGGKERNKHEDKKSHAGRGPSGKQPVLGMRERGGRSVAVPVPTTTKAELQSRIVESVQQGATVCTDEHPSYEALQQAGLQHVSVNHSAGEYVGAKDVHVNSTESTWALLRRSLLGTWHHCSRKP